MKYKASVLLKIFLLVLLVNISAVSEQPNDANNLTELDDYLTFTALNNAGLEAAFEQWKSALEQVPQSGSLPDPKFTYGYFIKEIETRTGPQRQRLSLMQTFPWFGKIEARTDAASAAAKAAHKRYEAAKLELFYKVKDLYYEYAYLGQAVELAKQNLELLKHFEEVARTRYTAAAGSHPDIIRAQIELATLEDKLKSLEEMRKPIVIGLNSVLNRGNDSSLPWPAKQQFIPVTLDHQVIVDKMIAGNPQLQALDFEVAAAKAKIELARKKFYPDISLGVDWIQTDKAISAGVRDSGKDPVIAMLSINLPFWTDSYKAAQLQAKAQMRSHAARKVQSRNDLLAQLEKVLYEFEDSARKVNLFEGILIPKAKEMLEASEVAYKAGTLDFLSLIDAQRTLLEFELSYERAVTTNLQKLAQLEMLVAEQLTGKTAD
jgi:cobalt-zinc-cadmium efflux system outer membrane protein